MNVFKAYKNYGVLAAEKRIVWTCDRPHFRATCSDEVEVKVPEKWDLWKNVCDETCVTSPEGEKFLIAEILKGNENPCFSYYDKNGKERIVRLECINE